MNLLVFGASGGTGRELVRQALDQGDDVTAFVRDPAKFAITGNKLTVVRGDATDPGAVAAVIPGHDAMLSALGAASPLKREPALVEAMRHIVTSMERASVRRLVYMSFVGVRESRDEAGFFIRHIASRLLASSIADHELREAIIRASSLDWVIVRPPKLTDGPRTGIYRSGLRLPDGPAFRTISRADVAEFMLLQVRGNEFVGCAPTVSY